MNKDITIEEFIRINDEVLCGGSNEENYGYCSCYVHPEGIDGIYISDSIVRIEYQPEWEDWTDTWVLPKKYFDMSDEEILAHAKAKYEKEVAQELEQEYNQDMRDIKRLAEKLGYELVKKGE